MRTIKNLDLEKFKFQGLRIWQIFKNKVNLDFILLKLQIFCEDSGGRTFCRSINFKGQSADANFRDWFLHFLSFLNPTVFLLYSFSSSLFPGTYLLFSSSEDSGFRRFHPLSFFLLSSYFISFFFALFLIFSWYRRYAFWPRFTLSILCASSSLVVVLKPCLARRLIGWIGATSKHQTDLFT